MKNYTEQEVNEMWQCIPFPVKQRLMAVAEELDRACLKHPQYPFDRIHQAAIITEESGELMRACLQQHYENGSVTNIVKEAIQTGAMAVRMLIHLPCTGTQNLKWIKETDTQHLPEPVAPVKGEYICTTPYTNALNFNYDEGCKLIVERYNDLYDVVICHLPGDSVPFEMSVDELLEHYTRTEMLAK